MDVPAPVVQPQNPLDTIGKFQALRAQQLSMQGQDIANQQAGVNLQQSQTVNPYAARTAAAGARTAEAGANVAEQTQAPKIAEAGSQAQTAAEQAQQQHLATSRAYVSDALQSSLAASVDQELTPEKYADMVTAHLKKYGQASPENLARALAQLPPSGTSVKGMQAYALQNAATALTQSDQLDKLAPPTQLVQTGQTVTPVAGGGSLAITKPGTIAGPSVQMTAPPTTEVVDPTTGAKRLLGSAGQPGPQTALSPQQIQNATNAAAIRQSSNEAAATYPQSQFNNNQIIKLAQSPNALGEGGGLLSKLGGQWAGIPWTSDMSTNYNNIGHFMGLQALTQMKAAGLAGTDADKSLSQAVTGNQTYTKDSLVNIARVNRALSEGSRLFNEGVERANASGDPSQVNAFRNQWSSAANVDGFMLYNAKRAKADDPSALPDVVKEMGGTSSPRYKAALQSIDAMRGLIVNGRP